MEETTSPVPDHGSLDEEDMSPPEPEDPWQDAAAARRNNPGPEAAEFERFREFMVSRQASGGRSWRPRREAAEEDDDHDQQAGDRSNAGPAPSWDGTTAFKDYQIRAKLWLATTRTKPKARGPMLLKNLSGTPFDDMKYLAKDSAWMLDPDNGEKLLSLMDSKDLYGEDQREDMINTLVKITYTLRRAKGESNKAFFARWDNVVRKLQEHQVKLPEEYLGFLLTNALNLSNDELKLLLNFSQGRLKVKDVKEWLRVHETEFETKQVNKISNQKANQVLHTEAAYPDDEEPEEDEDRAESLEVLLGALQELDGELPEEPGHTADEVFDEQEAKEVLAAMVKEHAKGVGKRTFTAVNRAKKTKALARGYGVGRDAGGRFRESPAVKIGGSYKVSIEALKRRTRCGICREIGHWHRECPKAGNNGGGNNKEAHYLESEEALFLDYIEYLDFKDAADSTAASSYEHIGPPPGLSDLSQSAAYTVRVHELNRVERHEPISEDQCATVDTGCQRTAIGADTLNRFLSGNAHQVGCCFKPETLCFKSVNGVTRTTRTACLPTSLGKKGCILRPAIFEEGQSRQAPFLLSLPFLIYCRATLHLDPQAGLSMHLRRFNHHVPLHIGPTGALRVPLDQFNPKMLQELGQAIKRLSQSSLTEIHHVLPEAGPSSSNQIAPADPEDLHHDVVGIATQAQPPGARRRRSTPRRSRAGGASLCESWWCWRTLSARWS